MKTGPGWQNEEEVAQSNREDWRRCGVVVSLFNASNDASGLNSDTACERVAEGLSLRIMTQSRKGSAMRLENQEVPFNRLFTVLRDRLQGKENGLVIIKADRAVVLNKAVRVMDVAKAAGAGRLVLATEKNF